jgi:hypothetical protein
MRLQGLQAMGQEIGHQRVGLVHPALCYSVGTGVGEIEAKDVVICAYMQTKLYGDVGIGDGKMQLRSS